MSILPRIAGLRKATKSPLHRELLEKRIAELKSRIPVGGVREAVIRGLLYAGMGRAAVDERGFELARRIRQGAWRLTDCGLQSARTRAIYILLVDEKAALAAIPSMLPADAEAREKAYDLITEVLRRAGRAVSPKTAGAWGKLRGCSASTAVQ